MRFLVWFVIAIAALTAVSWMVPTEWFDAIGEVATVVARPIFGPLLTLLSKPAFVYIASALMMLAAVIVCWIYYRRFVRLDMVRFRKLRAKIENLSRPGDVGAPSPDQALASLGSILAEARCFVSRYDEYLRERGERGRIPSEAFERRVHAADWSHDQPLRSIFAAMPGYFTTIGLIATFAGLVAALYFAARGFRTGNSDEAQMAIIQLLHASSFKFLTSVAALAGAFMISLFLRISEALVRIEAIRTAAAIDTYLRAWTWQDKLVSADARLDALTAAVAHLTRVVGERLPAPERAPS